MRKTTFIVSLNSCLVAVLSAGAIPKSSANSKAALHDTAVLASPDPSRSVHRTCIRTTGIANRKAAPEPFTVERITRAVFGKFHRSVRVPSSGAAYAS
ncbi:MAG: hypothetical protein ACPG3X_03625 [Opitutales bacterium]